MSKEKTAAVITIKRAADMTAKGRRQVAAWIRRQAMHLLKRSKKMHPRFTARYLYKD